MFPAGWTELVASVADYPVTVLATSGSIFSVALLLPFQVSILDSGRPLVAIFLTRHAALLDSECSRVHLAVRGCPSASSEPVLGPRASRR